MSYDHEDPIEESWEYIEERQAAWDDFLRASAGFHEDGSESSHRLLHRTAAGLSVAFLAGWITLLAAGRLGAGDALREWAYGCAFLHVICLGLICALEFWVMRRHARQTERVGAVMDEAQAVFDSMREEVQRFADDTSVRPLRLASRLTALEEKSDLTGHVRELNRSYESEGRWLGLFAGAGLALLILSLLLSTAAWLRFLIP
jgi:hypothetical protein